MFKNFCIILLTAIISLCSLVYTAHAKSRKVKCNTPVYFFTDVTKHEFFGIVDEYLQDKKAKVVKFYPELGFVYVKKTDIPDEQFAAINIKQFGNDVYMFVDEDKNKRDLQNAMYKKIKSKNSSTYKIINDFFCEEFKKDTKSLLTKKKVTMRDDIYNPFIYTISVKRYVGYKRYLNQKKKEKPSKKQEKI